MPDPKESGISDLKKSNIPVNNENRNVTPLGSGLIRDTSNASFMGVREGSANRIVEDKHLGPAALKLKVNQPGVPGMPRPVSRYVQNQAQSAPSKREATKGNDDYSDEDYEDNFDDAADNGVDEMERIR